jgi:hypothetical protein
MPTAEGSLHSILTAGSPNDVAALVGPRVYWDVLPQAPDVDSSGRMLQAIRLQRISTERSQYRTLDGKAEYARVRFQIDCYGASRLDAVMLAQAVYRLLEGFTGIVSGLRIDTTSTEDEGADIEPGAGVGGANLYRQHVDALVFHPE